MEVQPLQRLSKLHGAILQPQTMVEPGVRMMMPQIHPMCGQVFPPTIHSGVLILQTHPTCGGEGHHQRKIANGLQEAAVPEEEIHKVAGETMALKGQVWKIHQANGDQEALTNLAHMLVHMQDLTATVDHIVVQTVVLTVDLMVVYIVAIMLALIVALTTLLMVHLIMDLIVDLTLDPMDLMAHIMDHMVFRMGPLMVTLLTVVHLVVLEDQHNGMVQKI